MIASAPVRREVRGSSGAIGRHAGIVAERAIASVDAPPPLEPRALEEFVFDHEIVIERDNRKVLTDLTRLGK
jgi:hypothetical protein